MGSKFYEQQPLTRKGVLKAETEKMARDVTNGGSTTGTNGLSAYGIGAGGALTPIALSSSGSTAGLGPNAIVAY